MINPILRKFKCTIDNKPVLVDILVAPCAVSDQYLRVAVAHDGKLVVDIPAQSVRQGSIGEVYSRILEKYRGVIK